MIPIRRSAALAAGFLFVCLGLLGPAGCASEEDGYASHRPWRASLDEQVEEDVAAIIRGMRRAHTIAGP
jgi:hypothetical protein